MTMTTKKKSYDEIADEYRLHPNLVMRWVELQLLPQDILSEGFGSIDELRLKFVMKALDFGFSLGEIKFLMEHDCRCLLH